MLPKKLLFLTLNTFSSTGGIEKVCQVAGKALQEVMEEGGGAFMLYSAYDRNEDLNERYLPRRCFTGFSGKRLRFIRAAVQASRGCEAVVLSHINLLPIGWLFKVFSPRTRLYLIAHGIEVWRPLSGWKISLLQRFERLLPVSAFTQKKMQELYGLPQEKFRVLNNCLDPFLEKKASAENVASLRQQLGFGADDRILFTLTRLKWTEQYKGYDRVIRILPRVLEKYPHTRYLIAGKYDAEEKNRLDQLISELGLEDRVHFAGFVADEAVASYFGVADVYIMPSTGEGFGIVFIEALFYGKPVIAGNVDGSTDALDNGRFGLLVNPEEPDALSAATLRLLDEPTRYLPDAEAVMEKFGFEPYKTQLKIILGGSA